MRSILQDLQTCPQVSRQPTRPSEQVHYLLTPPLTLADLPILLPPLPDEIHTPVPPPAGQPTLTITYPGGHHLLMVHLAPLSGAETRLTAGPTLRLRPLPGHNAARRAALEQAASVKHYLMKEPLSGDELLHYRFTRRKKKP
jgi:hypothetical protein